MTLTSPARTAPDDALSAEMRRGSAIEHDKTNGSSFMSALLDGRMSAEGYLAYLQRLRLIYGALEAASATMSDDPVASAVIDPALDRSAAIDADLAHWAPEGAAAPASPATDAYLARIAESVGSPGLFVAHHYTRYLGDLSGGQALGRILDRTFELDGRGVDFYTFDEIPKVKPYKDRYREQLDAIGATMSADERERLLDEVRIAFGHNLAVLVELSEQFPTQS